jgi:hypothetical protein
VVSIWERSVIRASDHFIPVQRRNCISVFLFLSAYDPQGKTSGSIDPLGVLQNYLQLADLLLPGITTVTRRSRYVSMLCSAIANAEDRGDLPPGPVGLTRRRKAVEPFERLWALACVAAREKGHENAADGLRGVTYAQRALPAFRGDNVSPAFDFLKYQERTGAIGTYWTALVAWHLINGDTGELLPDGKRLAKEFETPPLTEKALARLADPLKAADVKLPRNDLLGWARHCHLAAAGAIEKQLLRDLLVGQASRGCVARALLGLGRKLPAQWNVSAWRQLKRKLATDNEASRNDLPVVIEAMCALEAFHEAALAAFETLLWWGTEFSQHTMTELAGDPQLAVAVERTRETARDLQAFFHTCECKEIRKALNNLQELAREFECCKTAGDLLDGIRKRHRKVQEGKVDGGVPKSEWLSVSQVGQVLRPAPRFQRLDRPPPPMGEVLTHPYRIEAFIEMLRENDFFPSAAA